VSTGIKKKENCWGEEIARLGKKSTPRKGQKALLVRILPRPFLGQRKNIGWYDSPGMARVLRV